MSLIERQEGRKFAAEMLMQASHLPRAMFDERGPVETMGFQRRVVLQITPWASGKS